MFVNIRLTNFAFMYVEVLVIQEGKNAPYSILLDFLRV